MKRWFCGFSSTNNTSFQNLPKPQDGQNLWQGENPFWVCGTWAKQQIITLFDGPVRLAIVGTCLEPYKSLVELFHNAVRSHDYSRLMRLPGNYNLIVQEKADTYVFTDVAGLRPAFYTAYNSGVVYSSLGIVLQQLIKAEVDPIWIANFLVGIAEPRQAQNRSPFCNVQTVLPGHYLHISNGIPKCKQYWHGPQEYISLSQGAEQLREQLITAVEGRVNLYSNVTSDLSGGFDSTSLALLAAKNLEKKGQNLHTITLKTDSNLESEDLKYAQHAASLYPNISPVMIENDELPADYSHLDSIPLIDSPVTAILCIGAISYAMKIIKSKGSQLHMNGEGGDVVISAPNTYLSNLINQGRIKTFIQDTYGWSRLYRSSPIPLITSAIKLSFTSYRQSLLQQAKKLTHKKQSPQSLVRFISDGEGLGWDSAPDVVSWYTRNLVDSVAAELHKWAAEAMPLGNSPEQHQAISLIQFNGFCTLGLQQLAENYDVNVEFPYLDSLVVDACLSVRSEERTNPWTFKPLLSTALQYDLPPSVFTRKTKGDYTSDEFVGLRQNLAFINELLQTSVLADMGLIDIKDFRTAVTQFNMGLVNTGFSAFSQTLAMELWLRNVIDTNVSNNFWENNTIVNRQTSPLPANL
ncbi:albusnodin/ikarugamycin family macrolactam cyclase [Nostoc sp. MG11]|uniref:albusnodin/ikarugamycin family macrolactam cyclase n=1 Tax=Nostoc sp. MG11 TaxID=2721166 RepID=UPI0018671B0F|nr:albusnodin/ikarugamycin family macrolactam cyclase [Nostoc sp. MG11]